MVCGFGFRWWVGLVLEGYFRPGGGLGWWLCWGLMLGGCCVPEKG